MIEVIDWQLSVVSKFQEKLPQEKYVTAFTCPAKYDDRGDWVNSYLTQVADTVLTVSYDPINIQLTIGNKVFGIQDFDGYTLPNGKVLVDATSLALPEVVHLFRLLKHKKTPFDVIYVQPSGYNERKEKSLDRVVSFDLSDDGLGAQQLPPFVGFSSDASMCLFLGFEGHRVGSIIHSDEYNTNNATCLIGAPAFQIGWENQAFANNYKQIQELSKNMNARLRFAGANDPIKTYETIDTIYTSLKYDKKGLCLAPFGTKPAAIAAAQFVVNNDGVILLYDFVQKKARRSSGTDLIHVWSFAHNLK
ncbi:hypothetical protein J8M20_15175 [Pseudoalteromonas luteoviolacea]|uniref:hypothetical protein n=1 Tax=Pseudoalteromonas luteoviolacea TaxID=43657 RepID=UPI001B3948E6|nr:hypothetical protein [Pseudoalteromonas luteoviolacea]MBQ4812700.1 hypothetical protein [Pseudoalteromonas luteoviolacea]